MCHPNSNSLERRAASRRHPRRLWLLINSRELSKSLCFTLLETMLQTRLLSALRPTPTFSAAALRSGLHSKATPGARAFFRSGLLAISLKAAPNSKTAFTNSPILQSLRRSVSTESTVITQPSQANAWKRFGITAVCKSFMECMKKSE